jgi:RNA polymerase sigma-70 factor (ECF subfamily)
VEFEVLANRHKDAVYRQMLRVCGNREDAEDVLIDALLRAWRHLDRLEDAEAFRGWLARIAQRVCWRLKGREKLHPLLRLSSLPQAGAEIPARKDPIDSNLDSRRMELLLHQAIDRLPDSCRSVYRLRDLEEVPGEETARRLGISLASMKSRLHRARRMVRKQLDEDLLKGHNNA